METRKCRILLPASEPVAYRLVLVIANSDTWCSNL